MIYGWLYFTNKTCSNVCCICKQKQAYKACIVLWLPHTHSYHLLLKRVVSHRKLHGQNGIGFSCWLLIANISYAKCLIVSFTHMDTEFNMWTASSFPYKKWAKFRISPNLPYSIESCDNPQLLFRITKKYATKQGQKKCWSQNLKWR